MERQYTTSEQFVIKFYQFFKLKTKAQQKILADKKLSRMIIEEFLGD